MVMDFDELMLKKLSGSKQALPLPEPSNDQNQVNLMDVDIPPPLQSNQRSKKTLGLNGPLASMRPRVKCSQCDFTGKEGQEMRGHVEKKNMKLNSSAKNVTSSQRSKFCRDNT